MTHLTHDELVDYVAKQLPPAEMWRMEAHFAVCDHCLNQVRELRRFARAWPQWTAETHGRLYARAHLNSILKAAAAETENPHWQKRLAHWQTAWSGKARAAVNLIVESAIEVSRLAAAGAEQLIGSDESWEFELATERIRSRGPGAPKSASAQKSPKVTVQAEDVELSRERHQAKILLDLIGNVTVRIKDLGAKEAASLVVLYSLEDKSFYRVAELQPAAGEAGFEARFKEIPAGSYIAAIEPR